MIEDITEAHEAALAEAAARQPQQDAPASVSVHVVRPAYLTRWTSPDGSVVTRTASRVTPDMAESLRSEAARRGVTIEVGA